MQLTETVTIINKSGKVITNVSYFTFTVSSVLESSLGPAVVPPQRSSLIPDVIPSLDGGPTRSLAHLACIATATVAVAW